MNPTQKFESVICEGVEHLEDGSRRRIAYIRISHDVTLGDSVADTRLLACAPELYQALKGLVDLLETTNLKATGRIPTVAKERISKATELLSYIQGESDEQPSIEKCMEILQMSNDGKELSPRHLSLVQATIDGNLSELGQQELDRIYDLLKAGNYCDWFYGIEHLTQSHTGRVYWKGQLVESFGFDDDESEQEKAAAEEVAERCRYLESISAPICMRNVTCELDKIQFNP
ncbi:hypothetical protein VF14_03465 [Nostoc linckia z18]|uniref:Uncharacterized protein n=2 Tax=Nostoc linckia TaxID=92942 RepID=A0A9Q5ZGK2_NOSLI|nr:hypothetical protein [Nostoc linckia]PHK41439.1 hypothetical protein VF12_06445 [Nostoc linckia z15]PHK46940.1 hypothetical protein VF13_08105 [Nostoc linckia z16]PHJ69202.1 hypothetical protein VF02_00935 [Nostoc linckia z1]PHJ73353.1 hypothetical protein VF05_01950 [Nostoc linckia z3]PHJ78700.1 hypothetical protein VF03_00935 [Nostoc linckia z2]